MGRYDYGPEDVKNFRKQIIEHVVPYCKILSENKREILGLDHVYFYDGINFLEGDPKPKGTPDELVKHAKRMYRELSPERARVDFVHLFLNIYDHIFFQILMEQIMTLLF